MKVVYCDDGGEIPRYFEVDLRSGRRFCRDSRQCIKARDRYLGMLRVYMSII